jgi:hypothetical protein
VANHQDHDPVDQEFPLQEFPLQEFPDHDTPLQEFPLQESPVNEQDDQLLPLHELPDHDTPLQEFPLQEFPLQEFPLQEFPDQDFPFQTPADQDLPWASRMAISVAANAEPMMSCSPVKTIPSIATWSDPRASSKDPAPVDPTHPCGTAGRSAVNADAS